VEELKLDITGMSCSHCVARVTAALGKLPGVDVKNVDIGSATVRYDPHTTTAEQIAAAVTDAGYVARPAAATNN
jgi:copper chaperone